MKRPPFAQGIVADIIFSEREPGRDDLRDVVQWQMPDTVTRQFQAEARRQGTDLNTFIRDFVCAALTEHAEAIRRIVHRWMGMAASRGEASHLGSARILPTDTPQETVSKPRS